MKSPYDTYEIVFLNRFESLNTGNHPEAAEVAAGAGQQEAVEVIASRVGPGGQASLQKPFLGGDVLHQYDVWQCMYIRYVYVYNTIYIYIDR